MDELPDLRKNDYRKKVIASISEKRQVLLMSGLRIMFTWAVCQICRNMLQK